MAFMSRLIAAAAVAVADDVFESDDVKSEVDALKLWCR